MAIFSTRSSILTFLIMFAGSAYTQTHVVPAGQWNIDGSAMGTQPGDIMCLDATTPYSIMRWKNIVGTAEQPIIITNCGGQATISSTGSYGWKFENSEHFKILGNGSPDYQYGIKVSTTTGFYLTLESFSTNFEISNVEIAGLYENGIHEDSGFAGIAIKTRPYCDGSSNRGVWDMTNISVHDNYIHDVGGEGVYIGHGFYLGRVEKSCKVGDEADWVTTYSHSIKGLRVFNNLLEDIGYDGIQIKNADEDAEIYNNIVRNYGTLNKGAHNEGIFVGNGTEALIYNNWVEGGTGHGMQIYAFGNTKIFNNVIINSGGNGMYLNNQSATIASKEGVFEIYNNTFVGIGIVGIELYPNARLDRGPLQTAEVKNNIFADYATESAGNGIFEANIFAPTIEEMKFHSPETHNYHLTSESPAVDFGTYVDLAFDYDYSTRFDGILDIGAFEYIETALSFISPLSDITVLEGESVSTQVQLSDNASSVEKVQYILNGKIIGTDVLPKDTAHTIGKNKLQLGNNEFYAIAVTFEGVILPSETINIYVNSAD